MAKHVARAKAPSPAALHAARALYEKYRQGGTVLGPVSKPVAEMNTIRDLANLAYVSHGTFDAADLNNFLEAIDQGRIPDEVGIRSNWSDIHALFPQSRRIVEAIGLNGSRTLPNPLTQQSGPGKGQPVDPGFTPPGIGPIGIGSWTSELGKVLSALTSTQFWIRAGEVMLGGVVIIVGIDQMLPNAGIARKVGARLL